ncbi:MAG: FAD binding domain-containing protein [Candidatus Methylomirabilia bacterium]
MTFDYHEPASVGEAVDLAARFGSNGRFLAGGTDLIVQIQGGKLAPGHVVSLRRVPGLAGIDVDGEITLGALVTHRALERCSHFQGPLRGLVEGAQVIGGHQVRNVGTVGGNIANASPAADVVPVLLTLDAAVTCLSLEGERALPLGEFLVGPGETRRRPEELLIQVRFPVLPPNSATAFLKAGRRKAMEISVVCVAARITLDRSLERCLEARIALGAVAPTAIRARSAEQCLEGRVLSTDLLTRAGQLAAGECQPIDDVRASARYRYLLVEAMVPRALARCLERIREEAR